MKPDSVVTWLWKPHRTYRSQFSARHVNVLRRMVQRHYPHPHRFICVTDMPTGLDAGIEIVSGWNDFAEIPSPHGRHNPSCYRRLRAFHPAAGRWLGTRFVMLDLDTVIVSDLTPLWDRPEDFVIWGETDPRSFYNGSMMLMTAGCRAKVWSTFNPYRSPAEAKKAGRFGSDQGHISHVLGPGEATWTTADGVYSYRVHLKHRPDVLPENAKIVIFHGGTDPWQPRAQQYAWVREHWRTDLAVPA